MALSLTLVAPDTGPLVGTTLTLTGTGFIVDTTVVVVGGAYARNVVVAEDGLSLTAVAPPHSAGLVDVSVINPAIIPQTLTDAFTYVPGQWALHRLDLKPRREQSA